MDAAAHSENTERKKYFEEELSHKDQFDNVGSLNKKPAVVAAGLDSSASNSKDNGSVSIILHEVPDLYNKKGDFVKYSGYSQIPNALVCTHQWLNAKPVYQSIFLQIFTRLAWQEQTYDSNGRTITILPGEICVTRSELMRYCGKHITENEIRGAIKYFCSISVQLLTKKNTKEFTKGKSHLSVRDTVLWKMMIESNHQIIHQEIHQGIHQGFTNKEKENKNIREYIAIIPGGVGDVDNPIADAGSEKEKKLPSRKRKKIDPSPVIQRSPGIFTTQKEHEKLIEKRGSEEAVNKIYEAVSLWKDRSGIEGGNDYSTCLKWQLTTAAAKTPRAFKLDRDESPSNPSKILDLRGKK